MKKQELEDTSIPDLIRTRTLEALTDGNVFPKETIDLLSQVLGSGSVPNAKEIINALKSDEIGA